MHTERQLLFKIAGCQRRIPVGECKVKIRGRNGRDIEAGFFVRPEHCLDASHIEEQAREIASQYGKYVGWRYIDFPVTTWLDNMACRDGGEDSYLRTKVGELTDEINRRLRAGEDVTEVATDLQAVNSYTANSLAEIIAGRIPGMEEGLADTAVAVPK
jgi:hypothetical protein